MKDMAVVSHRHARHIMAFQGGPAPAPSQQAILTAAVAVPYYQVVPPQDIQPDRPIGYGAFGVVWWVGNFLPPIVPQYKSVHGKHEIIVSCRKSIIYSLIYNFLKSLWGHYKKKVCYGFGTVKIFSSYISLCHVAEISCSLTGTSLG